MLNYKTHIIKTHSLKIIEKLNKTIVPTNNITTAETKNIFFEKTFGNLPESRYHCNRIGSHGFWRQGRGGTITEIAAIRVGAEVQMLVATK